MSAVNLPPIPEDPPVLDLTSAGEAAADRLRFAEDPNVISLLVSADRAGGLAVAASAPVVIRLAADALHYPDPANCAGPSWAGSEPVDAYAYCICEREWVEETCQERDRMLELAAALLEGGSTEAVSADTANNPQLQRVTPEERR